MSLRTFSLSQHTWLEVAAHRNHRRNPQWTRFFRLIIKTGANLLTFSLSLTSPFLLNGACYLTQLESGVNLITNLLKFISRKSRRYHLSLSVYSTLWVQKSENWADPKNLPLMNVLWDLCSMGQMVNAGLIWERRVLLGHDKNFIKCHGIRQHLNIIPLW